MKYITHDHYCPSCKKLYECTESYCANILVEGRQTEKEKLLCPNCCLGTIEKRLRLTRQDFINIKTTITH